MPSAREFSQLLKVQAIDAETEAAQSELEGFPGKREDLERRLQEEKDKNAAAKEHSKKLQVEHKEKENELKDQEAAIQKHQGELNNIKSNDAYKALISEIEQAKAKADELETEILEILDAIDASKASVSAEEKVLAEIEKTFSDEKERIAQREKALKDRLESLASERTSAAESLDAGLIEVYDKVRARRDNGIALAEAGEGDSCQACHVAIPPVMISDLKKGDSVVICENCRRILYLPEKPKEEKKEAVEGGG